MRGVLVILEGIADRPISVLDHKTPLQYAYKRNLNSISNRGINGMLYPLGAGICPGEAVSMFATLGYDPEKDYPGLSPIINAGMGTKLNPGDVALRGTFATVDSEKRVVDVSAGGLEEGGKILALSIDGMEISGVKVKVTSFDKVTSTSKRIGTSDCGVVLRGKGLSNRIETTEILENGVKVPYFRPVNGSEGAKTTAEVLNQFMENSMEVLKNSEINAKRIARKRRPANAILLRDPSIIPVLPTFDEKYKVKGKCIAGDHLVKGIARLIGMDVIEVEGATGTKYTNLIAKVEGVIEALTNNCLAILHIKMPDLYSMEKDPKGKVDAIERIDTALGYLIEETDEDTAFCVTSNYTRSTLTGRRTGDGVPITIVSPGIRNDEVKEFDEFSWVNGHIGRINGKSLIPYLLNVMDCPIEMKD